MPRSSRSLRNSVASPMDERRRCIPTSVEINARVTIVSLLLLPAIVLISSLPACRLDRTADRIDGRQEVVFWHFWGGEDRAVVDNIVRRFNRSQSQHVVRAIAMPGNNLDLKLFLAITGESPPDLVNQDDPILADWAARGAIMSLDTVATPDELQALQDWLFPAALQLGKYDGRLFGLCNGLDIRALYYNASWLAQLGLPPPQSLPQLDELAERVASANRNLNPDQLGFFPSAKMFWAWAIVFGGQFVDPTTGNATLDHPANVRALEWMAGYGERYGAGAISLRAQNQTLPGKTFPLFSRRYAAVVDGQWRVRDIARFAASRSPDGEPGDTFGVCGLPQPDGGLPEAGWVNGNFFLIPRGAGNADGAWQFMKFWTGFGGHEPDAAITCAEGGWIPVSPRVVAERDFQNFLRDNPLFQTFVELAASPHQVPRPNIPGVALLDREVQNVASRAMFQGGESSAAELLRAANARVNEHLGKFARVVDQP